MFSLSVEVLPILIFPDWGL